MTASYPINPSAVVNMSGNDEIVNNERTRANPITNPIGTNWMCGTGTPVSSAPSSSNSTALVAANLGTGIVIISPSVGSLTFTTDTAANIIKYMANNSAGVYIGDYLTCLVINGSSNAFTVGMGSGVTTDTNGTTSLPASTSRTFYFRATNVTPGSEAMVVYF